MCGGGDITAMDIEDEYRDEREGRFNDIYTCTEIVNDMGSRTLLCFTIHDRRSRIA